MDDYFSEFRDLLYDKPSLEDLAFQENAGVLSRLPGFLKKVVTAFMCLSIDKEVSAAYDKLYSENYESVFFLRDTLSYIVREHFPDPTGLKEEDLGDILVDLVNELGGVNWLIAAYNQTIERENDLLRMFNLHGKKYLHGKNYISTEREKFVTEKRYLVGLYEKLNSCRVNAFLTEISKGITYAQKRTETIVP